MLLRYERLRAAVEGVVQQHPPVTPSLVIILGRLNNEHLHAAFDLVNALLERSQLIRELGPTPTALGSDAPQDLVQFEQDLLMLRQGLQFSLNLFGLHVELLFARIRSDGQGVLNRVLGGHGRMYWRPAFSRNAISPRERYQTSFLEWDRQFRLVRVHHEHCEELGRLCLAGVGTDAVAVAGQLREALSGLVGRYWSVVDLTADRPLKHGCVDEGGFGMRVAWRIAAREFAVPAAGMYR